MANQKQCCKRSIENYKTLTLELDPPIGRCGECGDLIWIPTGGSFPEPFGEPIAMPDGHLYQEVEDGEWRVVD